MSKRLLAARHNRPDVVAALPRVSVVVPCYNYEAYLDQAIASALGQEGVDVDLTIVDDCSTDGSLEIAQRWAAVDERVRIIRHGQNRGHIATFNDALSSATAPYLVKLDPDDLLPPGALRRAAAVLDSHSTVTFVYGRCIQFEGAPPEVADAPTFQVKVWRGGEWLWRRARGGVNFISQPEVMIRRSALEAVGLHREEVPEASDYHLWLRLASIGDVARVRGPVQGLYRVHAQSMQRTIHAGALSDLRARARVFDLFVAEHAGALADPERFQQQVRRTLGREAVLRALDAFDLGRSGTEDIDAFATMATTLYPAVTRSVRWRELQHRIAAGRDRQTPRFAPTRIIRQRRWDHRVQWMRRYLR